jgi:hypothetical protein
MQDKEARSTANTANVRLDKQNDAIKTLEATVLNLTLRVRTLEQGTGIHRKCGECGKPKD